MAAKTTVSARDGSVEISNRRWLLRVGVDGWLNPGYLLDLERNLPLADEAYAYELALAPKGDSGFTGGRELTSGPAGDLGQHQPGALPRMGRHGFASGGQGGALHRPLRFRPAWADGHRDRARLPPARRRALVRGADSAAPPLRPGCPRGPRASVSVFARRSSTATANRGSMAPTARRSCPYRTGGAGGRSLITERPRIR